LTSDITYIWTDEGWMYLAVTLDLFNRQVVGWSVKPRMTAELVSDELAMAWFRRWPAPGADAPASAAPKSRRAFFATLLRQQGI
jgi:transposase InsO family protein